MVIVATVLSVGGTRVISYFANRLKNREEQETLETEAKKQQLALETEQERHSRESSKTQDGLDRDAAERDQPSIYDYLKQTIQQLAGERSSLLIKDNRRLNARVADLEQATCKTAPASARITAS